MKNKPKVITVKSIIGKVKLLKNLEISAILAFSTIAILIKNIYQQQTGFTENIYSEKLLSVAFPLYAFVWITMVYFNGGYDKPIKLL